MEETRGIKALDRYLAPVDVWAIAYGCMVGWGVFAMPGNFFLPEAGPAGTVIAMIIGMIIMLIIGENFSYLMNRIPVTGGVYTYTKEAFGRDHAFLSTWFLGLSYLTIVFLNGTALFLVVRIMLGSRVHQGIHYVVNGNTIYLIEAVISILVLALIGVLFVLAKAMLQKMLTVLAIIMLAGVVITGVFCLPKAFSSGAVSSFGINHDNEAYAIFGIVILAPWAFVGFEVTSFDTAHFSFPKGKIRRILFNSIVVAAISYISMALISIASVPDGFASWQEYIGGLGDQTGIASVPTFFAARSIMGTAGLVIMVITAIAAILTGIIGGYRAVIRVLSTMAENKILSERFSKTSFCILFVMGISIILAPLGRNTLNWFVDLTSLGAIVGYGYTSAAAFKIAGMEGERPIRVTGAIGTAISVLFVIVQLVPRILTTEVMGSEAFLLLAVWCILGFLFYWRTITKGNLTEYSGMSISGVILFALLLYSMVIWMGKRLMAGTSIQEMKQSLAVDGVILLIITLIGLAIMMYLQKLVRLKHEAAERERIRAVESSLAKSQFLFNMSHDIRTPMNAIIGYTNLAMKKEHEPEVRDYLQKIESSSQHLLSLINDILEMSRIESGTIELEYVPTDLVAMLSGMQDLFEEQMTQKGIEFKVYTNTVQDPHVWCDRKNLNRVLLNLLSNAYKFTPKGGSVSVSVSQSGSEDGYGSYEFRVQDTGIGMSREFADKMFNAFERERTSTVSGIEGTGLGLSITKSFVDLMGGTIEVITAPGSGTIIMIGLKLKIAQEDDFQETGGGAAPAEQMEADEEVKIDFSTKRLLLVEDNQINMEIAEMILTQAGFNVEKAENGAVAVDMITAADEGYYDAVLMDIQMPVMDGYEATRAIREMSNPQKAKTPIIAMTANAFKEDELAAEKAGMQGHIPKPIDVEIMMNTLTHVLSESERERKGEER